MISEENIKQELVGLYGNIAKAFENADETKSDFQKKYEKMSEKERFDKEYMTGESMESYLLHKRVIGEVMKFTDKLELSDRF